MRIASAREIVSLSRPLRSGPNNTPQRSAFSPRRLSSIAALSGLSTGFTISRGRAVEASTIIELADGALDAVVDGRLVDDERRTGRGGVRLVVRPAVARADQPQIGQPEIGHGARGKADILAELRVDENDGRRRRGSFQRSVPSAWTALPEVKARARFPLASLAFTIEARCYREAAARNGGRGPLSMPCHTSRVGDLRP